jgi:hypothetical protein
MASLTRVSLLRFGVLFATRLMLLYHLKDAFSNEGGSNFMVLVNEVIDLFQFLR